jgi:acetylornithine aminotransferase/acetylornithine/N-succinyldiaminopimelate aminotransferase
LKLARELTAKNDALLVVDEIQSGLGRTGRYFAYQHYDVLPDIVTVAKPLAAGLPLGAMLTTNKVANVMHPGLHGTTFGGGPLTCAVAVEFLKQLKKQLPYVEKIGTYFQGQLDILREKHSSILEVRGLGLMLAMELDSADLAKAMVKKLMLGGIIINRTHETVLRFLPPYIIEKKHIDQVIAALDKAFTVLTKRPDRNKQHEKEISETSEVELAHA